MEATAPYDENMAGMSAREAEWGEAAGARKPGEGSAVGVGGTAAAGEGGAGVMMTLVARICPGGDTSSGPGAGVFAAAAAVAGASVASHVSAPKLGTTGTVLIGTAAVGDSVVMLSEIVLVTGAGASAPPDADADAAAAAGGVEPPTEAEAEADVGETDGESVGAREAEAEGGSAAWAAASPVGLAACCCCCCCCYCGSEVEGERNPSSMLVSVGAALGLVAGA